MASKASTEEKEGSVLQKVQPPKLKQPAQVRGQPGGNGVPLQPGGNLPLQPAPGGLPLTKTNLKLMTVLSNSCTVFTGQVIYISNQICQIAFMQVDCDNLITPDLPVRKISHDLPYQVNSTKFFLWHSGSPVAGLLGGGCQAGFLQEKHGV